MTGGALWAAALLALVSAVDALGTVMGAGGARFGALFAVHGAPLAARAGARCGPVREHYGIQRVEATLQALDALNAPRALLGSVGLRLTAELRDSCWAPPTALRQTIDLVRDSLAASPPALAVPCAPQIQVREPLVGVLGPGASAAAVQVQNLLQLFAIPQVSYSATSMELSDRARFSTFFRVVPSDRHQARLLVALLRAHNWTYVHAVHTDESYGQSGMAAFRAEAARGGVCVAREAALRAAPSAREVDAALTRLAGGGNARVCVCWCEGRTARVLLAGLARRGVILRLVASDGWADRRDVVHGLEQPAAGALTLRIRSPYLTQFDEHYHALRPVENTRNPWFTEFWEQKFNCSLSDSPPNAEKRCTGRESLAVGYTQEPKLALVVRGVHALAHALRDMHRTLCGEPAPPGVCAAMLPFNVTQYRHHLGRVRFRAPDGGLVAFDHNGDPPAELSEYDVMSFEGDAASGWRYVRVGRWARGALRLRGGAAAAQARGVGVRGTCGRPCGPGWWARPGAGRARCCWTCVPCPPMAVVRAPPAAGCRPCAPGHRPDTTRTVCLPVELEWGGSAWARGAAAGAGGMGLAAATLCGAVLWRHRTTPVVKSASRELCALLLASAAACHCAALLSAAPPSAAACIATRMAPPALAGVYASVLTRTVRVARLVAASERPATARHTRLLSSRAQLWAWACLIAPGLTAAVWSAVHWPAWPHVLHPTHERAVLACGGQGASAQLVPLAPALLLLAACVVLAVRTRRLPHNFNETRFIGAAAYTTCVTWAGFVPLYAVAETRTVTLCACVSLSAGTCVALSLGPRLWVCIFRPERNTRAHFLTATSIRCHVGGQYRAGAGSAPTGAVLPSLSDAASQTAPAPGSDPTLAPCDNTVPCARVRRVPAEVEGGADHVVILLLQHEHRIPWEAEQFFINDDE